MPLGTDEREELRRIMAEEIRAHVRAAIQQFGSAKGGGATRQVAGPTASNGGSGQGKWATHSSTVPLVHGILPSEQASVDGSSDTKTSDEVFRRRQSRANASNDDKLNRVAHSLGHTQVEISRELESSLQNLHELVIQAETTAEKIRSILRRTEPTRRGHRGGGAGKQGK